MVTIEKLEGNVRGEESMPDYTVELTSKTVYGPFSYVSASRLRAELVEGKLNLSEMVFDEDCPVSIKIKELKPEK